MSNIETITKRALRRFPGEKNEAYRESIHEARKLLGDLFSLLEVLRVDAPEVAQVIHEQIAALNQELGIEGLGYYETIRTANGARTAGARRQAEAQESQANRRREGG